MKKLFLLLLLISAVKINAQNFQLHYDLGEDRKYLTSTIEMFKPDEYGATFFFVDFDYNRPGNKSISLSYFEIARYVTVYDKLSVTAQYNDGQGLDFPLGQSFLAGLSYPIDLGFVTLNTDLLAKKTYNSEGIDGQLTVVWFVPLFNNLVNFTGFLDVWSQDNILVNDLGERRVDGKEMVLLTEPQIWFNVINHLAVGTEIEISKNFISDDVKVMPTLAAKWTF